MYTFVQFGISSAGKCWLITHFQPRNTDDMSLNKKRYKVLSFTFIVDLLHSEKMHYDTERLCLLEKTTKWNS